MHVPNRVSASTPKQTDPTAQSSRPWFGLPSRMHASPDSTGWSATGTHCHAFHDPPSVATNVHFCPAGQSCSSTLHVLNDGMSEDPMNVLPISMPVESAAGEAVVPPPPIVDELVERDGAGPPVVDPAVPLPVPCSGDGPDGGHPAPSPNPNPTTIQRFFAPSIDRTI